PVEGAGGDIAISIAGANPVAGLPVTGGEDGSYSAVYTPIASGTDQVDVRLNGQAVPGSPFLSVVAPGPASAATTTASVKKGGFFFYSIDILVTTRDAQGNLLNRGGDLVQVHLDGGIRNAVDHGNGNYSDSFVTLNPVPEITITLNGAPISGSPFRP
ncbi:MAG TPA: filamin/ABP280 repeat domain-containing protein, partial [Gemmatimonadales bacterium]|nr:filamin/ABP280 repeat domain-containing protein [Gemmatimonadales bacterium]